MSDSDSGSGSLSGSDSDVAPAPVLQLKPKAAPAPNAMQQTASTAAPNSTMNMDDSAFAVPAMAKTSKKEINPADLEKYKTKLPFTKGLQIPPSEESYYLDSTKANGVTNDNLRAKRVNLYQRAIGNKYWEDEPVKNDAPPLSRPKILDWELEPRPEDAKPPPIWIVT